MKLNKQRTVRSLKAWWHKSVWNKAIAVFLALLVLAGSSMYGVAYWYQASVRNQPLRLGVTFVPAYAEFLGLDAKQTMEALTDDIGVRHFRLVSYWSQMEPQEGQYDFSALDWQFEKAENSGATVSLALGLRQPRWPECHWPEWARDLPKDRWQPRLEKFIAAVVNRYKNSPALESYQLENEFLLKNFGNCKDFDRERVAREFDLVKKIDPKHPVIMSRSNNWYGLALGQPVPDEYGISVYRRIWEPNVNRYVQYPFPSWYYGFLAGAQKIIHGRDSILHELQAEAWPPNGQSIPDTSLDEQNKSIDAQRLRGVFAFGEATGLREIYLWGAEYWYYRSTVLDDPSLWDVAKEEFAGRD